MTDRIPCCIPGCRRSFKRRTEDGPNVSIMCLRHWNMGDQRLRNRQKQLRKRSRWFKRKYHYRSKLIDASPKHDKFFDAWHRAADSAYEAWHRVRADVEIKAAFGAEDAPRRRPRTEE
jgi:hypothetical protein